MLNAQNNHNNQLYIDQNSNYADFKFQTAMELVYKVATMQSLIDYRYSDTTDYLYVANLYNDLIEQLRGFGQFGFTLGVSKLTDDMIITSNGTFNVNHYLKELGVKTSVIDELEKYQNESIISGTYVVPHSLTTSPNKTIMIHQISTSKLDPIYFFIVFDSVSLLPKTIDHPDGNFYLYTDELITSYIYNEQLTPEILNDAVAINEQNHIKLGKTTNYIHHAKLIPNLHYVYISEVTAFSTIFFALWKTALFQSMLLLLLGLALAYIATRSSYEPIRQLLQFLYEHNKARTKETTKSTNNVNGHSQKNELLDPINEIAYIKSSIEHIYSINSALQNKLDHSFVHLREDFFRKVIYGIASEQFISENLSTLKLEVFQDQLNIMLLECEGLETMHESAPLTLTNLPTVLHTMIKEQIGTSEHFFLLSLDHNKYCIIFHDISAGQLQETAKYIINGVENNMSLDIIAYISETYSLLELTSALQELLRLSNYQYAAVNKIITTQFLNDTKEDVCHYPIEMENFLISYVDTNELNKALELLGNLIEENEKLSKLSPSNLSSLKHSLLTTFKRCLNNNNKTLNQFVKDNPDVIDKLMEVNAVKFSEQAFSLFELIFDYCNKDKFSLESSTASQIFMYINQHFDKDLSLTDISNHFNLSESYVSKLLKNSLDINFKQYINTLKVKRAKELLSHKTYKVHEVATIVGCNNTNTFIRIFKQYIGVSPGEYLKNLN